MSLRSRIEDTFGYPACDNALLYKKANVVRFALSDVPGSLEYRVRVALRNALQICSHIFNDEGYAVVCLSTAIADGTSALKAVYSNLRKRGVPIDVDTESWVQVHGSGDDEETTVVGAVQVPLANLSTLLLHAVSVDAGGLDGGPSAGVFVFNISHGLAAHPYDDRGMDVFGPNIAALSELTVKFNDLVLESRISGRSV